MKTIIVALAIIGSALSAQGSPLATSYCMGNTDGVDTCSSCYNYGLGTINPRIKVGSSCALAATTAVLVTDCLYYRGDLGSTRSVNDCGKCNSKLWMNIDDNASPDTIACAATASDTSCTTVTNCDQQYCLKSTATIFAEGCKLCSSGYKGTGDITTVGFPGCVSAASAIPSCTYYNPLVVTECILCATGNAVATSNTACTTFAVDANCRKLGNATGTLYCGECKPNYYFTLLVCTLGYDASTAAVTGANLMAVSAAFMALAVFFN